MSEKYYRNSVVEVDLEAVHHNFTAIQALHEDKTFIAVIKANAYGLGSTIVAEYLAARGAEFFAVATLDEAIELRMHGIKKKILVLGPINPEDINKAIQHRVAITAPSLGWLVEAQSYVRDMDDKEVWIHIKVNSGMNRLGTSDIDEIGKMIDVIERSAHLVYEGIYSHFSSADIDSDQNDKEYEKFKHITSAVRKPKYVHVQNSAGSLRLTDDYCNAVRVGISLYGYYPSDYIRKIAKVHLKPSVGLKTQVVDVHVLEQGEGNSYGLDYSADSAHKIATLPLGYADGFLRARTGYRVSLEDGTSCPVVGKVCMDYIMIKVPDSVQPGDSVNVIVPDRASEQSMEAYSDFVGTIPYESLCMLARRLPRIYHGDAPIFVNNEVLK
ncbi:alanine racemase [Salinicoccus hispanicus]|uniref:Alanine racemase n=1 Tax=Salinicoccus hispanicus TaxID=157225 RepID=A0A6N8U1A5_9STAP|nr:alanine racemase [Salinicoccus hispanicus]MXQ51117.1 alanine racemase [Salinicoccus hispanicus]